MIGIGGTKRKLSPHRMAGTCMNHDEFWAFVRRPTLRGYRALRQQALASAQYDPQALMLHHMHAWCRDEDWLTAQLGAHGAFAEYQTSPRFHFLLGQAEEALGHTEAMDRCRQAFGSCLRMLLATGQGTEKRPYEAIFVTDINDVILALRLEARSRATHARGSRTIDVVTADDGSRLWFDVSEMARRVPSVARQRVASQV